MKTMKKFLITLLAFLALASQAFAVPAKPGRFSYTEPDGTVRQLERHGDEFFHWTTDANTGQVVELDMAGYWRPSQLDRFQLQQAQELRRQANEYRMAMNSAPEFNFGVRHIPVLLVEFTDVPFSVKDPHTRFNNLLNQRGYTDNQATGSVLDYFWENSHGLFTPVFDVFGPVTLPHEMAYYGEGKGSNNKAAQALIDGAQLLDSQIDFSQYDYDDDGAVDMMLMYFAGYSEAEGGPEDSIWPHQWYVNGYKTVKMDGKLLSRYFCTAELRGNKGSNLCSIGATCHEFSHALGLPDFYDTDYEENGECQGLYFFSIMASGCYLNDARTPPFYNAEERVLLGWMDPGDIRELPDGETRFGSVSENIAYTSLTDVEGEYYLYECRDGYSWDAYLPAGLLVYHVDKSPWRMLGGIPCSEHWAQWSRYNKLNAYGNHPCFYVVPSADQNNLMFKGALDQWVFPGSKRKTEFHPMDWDGNDSGVSIYAIRYDESDTQVSVSVENHYRRELRGTVLSLDGEPVQGVYISLTEPGASYRIRHRKGASSAAREAEATTGPDGTFVLDVMDFDNTAHLTALKSGYLFYEQDVELQSRITALEIHIRKGSETGESTLQLYDDNGRLFGFGLGVGNEMAASLFSASVLNGEAGRQISSFQYGINADYYAKELYFIVDDAATGERLLTYPVKEEIVVGEFVWADVSEAGFKIPAGKDLMIGYAVVEPDYEYPFLVFTGTGNYYGSMLNLERSQWTDLCKYGLDLMVSIALENGGETPMEDAHTLSEVGINTIDPGTGTYKSGETFQLQLVQAPGNPPSSVRWFWDGAETGAKSVTLTAGEHVAEAWLVYPDGSREILELPIKVQ